MEPLGAGGEGSAAGAEPAGIAERRDAQRRAFSETVDPTAYVPRAATEQCLARLAGWWSERGPGSTLAAVVAPPGFGKTLLLRLVESRLADAVPSKGVLYLPYAGLLVQDLAAWVHGLIGPSVSPPPHGERRAEAVEWLLGLGAGPAQPFYLLLDDADSMPHETARALAAGLPDQGSGLRIILATSDDARGSRLLAALDPLGPTEIPLRRPMDREETARYVRARWRWAGLGEEEGLPLDEDALARIHALSGGVPLRVHRVVAGLLEPRLGALPEALDSKQRREEWMGRPIEEGG